MAKYRYLILGAFLIFTSPASRGQENHQSTHGTLITLIGNKQGIVVVADSMGTTMDSSGRLIQLPKPFQKLMGYDEHTICATAGLLFSVSRKKSDPGREILPQLNLQVLGIVQAYRDAVKRSGKPQSMRDALEGLSGALRARFTTLADLDANLGYEATETIFKYQLRLRLAGFDLDGEPKIGSLDLTMTPQPGPWSDGQKHWTAQELERPQVEPIHDTLLIRSTGLDKIEKEMLAHPERFSTLTIMQEYISAMRKDQGASLSTEYMKQLGHLFKLRTAKSVREVGGADQVATIVKGRNPELAGLDAFLPITNPVQFTKWRCSPGAAIVGFGGDIVTGTTPVIFQSCIFEKLRLEMANNIFLHCTFRNVELIYNGGDVLFDDDNIIEGNSRIALLPNSKRYPETANRLASKFDFLHGGYATPPNQLNLLRPAPNP
jgi:hypothetical protein